ncbi:MAG: cytochrome c [Acidobacteriota bacterium]|nr:cytochrome c [Acidobacteriota bacterium]
MKRFTIVLAALAMMMTTAAFAQDGAATYKAKCAGCHGANAEGKMGPALKGKTDVVAVLTKGGLKGIHAKPFNGLSEADAKAIAGFLK